MPIIFIFDDPFTSEDFLNKLFPNIWSLLINLLALIVLFIALYFLAYKPVSRYLKARKDHIEGDLKEARVAKEKAQKVASESENIIAKAKDQADEIVKEAKSNAQVVSERLQKEAEEEIRRKKEMAEEDILKKKEKAAREMKKEMVEVALSTSEKILGRSINEEDEKRFLQEFKVDEDEKK